MPALPGKKSMLQKQMPTLLGVGVLVVSLVAGLLYFGQGTGVFAPRATPQTTPKNVKVTNITDTSFTVSFFTDEPTAAFLRYDTDAKKATNKSAASISDDRAQLSGTAGSYNVHHITVRGLKPDTTYYYVLGTGSSDSTFDNQGTPFNTKTFTQLSAVPASTMIHGNIFTAGSTPAEGSVVYLSIDGATNLSALVRNTGSWGIPLSTARVSNGSAYATISDNTEVTLFVQGTSFNQTGAFKTNVASAQPVPDIKLGGGNAVAAVASESSKTTSASAGASFANLSSNKLTSTSSALSASSSAKDLLSAASSSSATASSSSQSFGDMFGGGQGGSAATVSTASATLTLSGNDEATPSAVVKSQPKIVGQAIPNADIQIEIHSDEAINTTVKADANGEFTVDLATLGQTLSPGLHTITYKYLNSDGVEETRTQTFLVEDTKSLIALANKSGTTNYSTQSYSSGNPYSVSPTPTPTPTPRPTLAASSSTTTAATDSGSKGGVSTRSALVSTQSGDYVAGSVETTFALVLGGLFFITTGIWSWYLAVKVEEKQE